VTTVEVSIISTDEFSKVESCLRSIAAQDFDGSIHVTVVCNGAPDDSAKIQRIYPGTTVMVNTTRKGFAENHNAALATTDADFVLVLNPDVELRATCIREMVAAMHAHPSAGIVGPLLRYPDGSPQSSARRFPRVMGTLIRRTPLRALVAGSLRSSKHYLPVPTMDRGVDWLLGACLLVRTDVWRSIGGFDPEFRPLYVEDIDLSWRIWAAGREVWQAPRAVAIHEHQAATDKKFFDHRTIWHLRGMIHFVRKHPGILAGKYPRTRIT
jgi:GT2 family glycosyltransferase